MKTFFCRFAFAMFALVAFAAPGFAGEIHDAAEDSDLTKLKTLLKDHPELINNKRDGDDRTPLQCAADVGQKEAAEFLIANKADVNAKDKSGDTALKIAANMGSDEKHRAIANLLLANKATYTIHDVASINDMDRVKALLKDHADLISSKDRDGETPLHCAALNGYKEMADFFIANKADVNAKDKAGETPLHGAAVMSHKDVAELLIKNKADVNAKDASGLTPLGLAAQSESKEMAALLFANNATFTLIDVTLLGDVERVKTALKDHPESVSMTDEYGGTALHLAAQHNLKDIAEVLLANKAEVNAQTKVGNTPLKIATQNGNKEVAEVIRQHGGKE